MADEKKAKLTGKETARITSIVMVGGKTYQPNQLVKNLPAKELQELIENQSATLSDADIKYCKEELKAEVIDHTAKPEPKAEKADSE